MLISNLTSFLFQLDTNRLKCRAFVCFDCYQIDAYQLFLRKEISAVHLMAWSSLCFSLFENFFKNFVDTKSVRRRNKSDDRQETKGLWSTKHYTAILF